ncbi:hypothetical protein ZWY2020_040658 [Hordeum vulgare]|nr:hypothetical protein ZWY2020_040658 [Hordeum vulgare]
MAGDGHSRRSGGEARESCHRAPGCERVGVAGREAPGPWLVLLAVRDGLWVSGGGWRRRALRGEQAAAGERCWLGLYSDVAATRQREREETRETRERRSRGMVLEALATWW